MGKEEELRPIDIVAIEYVKRDHSRKTQNALASVGYRIATGQMAFGVRELEAMKLALEERGNELNEQMADKIREAIEKGSR